MGRSVIQMDGVSKAFKKHHRRKRFLTLKSTLIRDIWNDEDHDDGLFWALKHIDFSVSKGETVGLIGSNGSGKSTLLKIIAGILKPNSGSIRIDGRLSALIELGAGFHPEISGRENIFINGIMLGLSKQDISRKFDEIVRFAELERFIDNPVRTYSSGMFMRLGFAVAIHVNPDILLIDEVLAVGDQSFVHKCLERIFDFKRRKKTIVLVSHDLTAVEKLCSRVVWLAKGEEKLNGSPREVIDSYLIAVSKREEERFASEHQQIQESLDALTETLKEKNPAKHSSEDNNGEDQQKKRWGDRRVEITHVVVRDSTGKERYVFKTGESVTIHLEYYAKEKVDHPVFGVGFFLQDGTWCYGSNTMLERKRIQSIQGTGWVDIRFDRLNFIQNSYLIDVAVHAEDGTPYDYHSRLYRLGFRSDIQCAGIFQLDHQWNFDSTLDIIEHSSISEE